MIRGEDEELAAPVRRAYDIHVDGSGDLPLRDRLQALILADASCPAIARRLDVDEEVVQAYEDYFFDVRTCLKYKNHILSVVIGQPPNKPYSEDEPGILLKVLPFLWGIQLYDGILSYLINRNRFEEWVAEAPSDREQLRRHAHRLLVLDRCLLCTEEKHQLGLIQVRFDAHKLWPLDAKPLPEMPGFETDEMAAEAGAVIRPHISRGATTTPPMAKAR